MATTPFLLQYKFNSNPLLFHLPTPRSFPLKSLSVHNNSLKLNRSSYKPIRTSPNSRIKCFLVNHNHEGDKATGGNSGGEDDDLKNVVKALQKPAVTAVVLLRLLSLYDGCVALAASGGRMGGRAFSSSSSSSTSSSSSPSSSSSSYSTRPEKSSPSYSSTSYSSRSSPELYSSSSYPASYYAPKQDKFGRFELCLLILLFVAMNILEGFSKHRSHRDITLTINPPVPTSTHTTTVLKFQVGLLGSGRSLQRDLNRIAEAADTSTPEGLSFVLQETTLALLRHPDYCISGYSSVDLKKSVEEGEKRFNQLSIEERGKFDEETLVNVNNIRKQSATSQRSNGFRNEYIVITIIVAAGGVHKLPPINSSAQLKEALQKLASIPSSRIMAVEVLWTPQNENDTLTERELLEDYSLLRPL